MRLASGLTRVAALSVLALGCASPSARPDELVVFAAASLSDVTVELAGAFDAEGELEFAFNFAGSNTLARQILATRRPGLFLSADRHWVETLDRSGALTPDSARVVLSNRLVVISNAAAGWTLDSAAGLAGIDFRYLALADPEAVPAGRYARAALMGLDAGHETVWEALAPRLVPTRDVRAALAMVASDPQIVGIVYRTDALTSDRVSILAELDADSALPIAYWGAVVGHSPAAGAFLDFLASDAAFDIAARHGFLPAP